MSNYLYCRRTLFVSSGSVEVYRSIIFSRNVHENVCWRNAKELSNLKCSTLHSMNFHLEINVSSTKIKHKRWNYRNQIWKNVELLSTLFPDFISGYWNEPISIQLDKTVKSGWNDNCESKSKLKVRWKHLRTVTCCVLGQFKMVNLSGSSFP